MQGADAEKAKNARRVMIVRKRGNLLLCTLLLGNTLVNALISILTAQMTSGLIGGFVATGVIVIFGEIIPQAACSRYGLRIGAFFVPMVAPLMALMAPVTYPMSLVLDKVLGDEVRKPFNKRELAKLFEHHMKEAVVDPEERRLLDSTLHFNEKTVRHHRPTFRSHTTPFTSSVTQRRWA